MGPRVARPTVLRLATITSTATVVRASTPTGNLRRRTSGAIATTVSATDQALTGRLAATASPPPTCTATARPVSTSANAASPARARRLGVGPVDVTATTV